jgi:hypothetical protein
MQWGQRLVVKTEKSDVQKISFMSATAGRGSVFESAVDKNHPRNAGVTDQ